MAALSATPSTAIWTAKTAAATSALTAATSPRKPAAPVLRASVVATVTRPMLTSSRPRNWPRCTSTHAWECAYSWNAATESLAYSSWGCRAPSGTWAPSPATSIAVPYRRRFGSIGRSGSTSGADLGAVVGMGVPEGWSGSGGVLAVAAKHHQQHGGEHREVGHGHDVVGAESTERVENRGDHGGRDHGCGHLDDGE